MRQSRRWLACDYDDDHGPCEAVTDDFPNFGEAEANGRSHGWAVRTTRMGKVVDLCPDHKTPTPRRGAATP